MAGAGALLTVQHAKADVGLSSWHAAALIDTTHSIGFLDYAIA